MDKEKALGKRIHSIERMQPRQPRAAQIGVAAAANSDTKKKDPRSTPWRGWQAS
jgi:hypothetical protein